MAHIEKVQSWYEINVDASVGKGGVNSKDDVLVVQALLKHALEPMSYFRNERFSEPTGVMDANTMNLIEKFQIYARRKVKVKLSVDGRIDPAEGMSAFGKKGRWSIRSLNAEAAFADFMFHKNNGSSTLVESICRRFPQVATVLGEIPVGTLGLTLESSPKGVGTLNLGLE